MHTRNWFALFLLLGQLVAFGTLARAANVAEVVFVSGHARWWIDSGNKQLLKLGDRLPEGATLETQSKGYLYLKTVDRGFFVLRPESRARLAEYRTDEAGGVAIRLELDRGVARLVSGDAAHKQPRGFRLETPLAVIGVRGTDFSVLSSEDATQITVRSGGIVASPFSASCQRGGAGPCEGLQAAELFASDAGHMVEVRRGAERAVRLTMATKGESRDAPEEGESLLRDGTKSGKDGALDTPLPVATENGALKDLGLASAPEPTIFWGRWRGTGIPSDGLGQLTAQGERETVALNQWYGVTRTREPVDLPAGGKVALALSGSEAQIVNNRGSVLAPAQVLDGSLLLDFGLMRFQTSLQTQGGGYDATLNATGFIDQTGLFQSSLLEGSNGTVRGATGGGGREAAYIFSQPLNSTKTVTGVTSWTR